MRRRLAWTPVLVLVLLLGACVTTVGPDYAPPVLDAGPAYQAPLPKVDADRPAAAWWTAFDDHRLVGLIEQGLAANLDLQLADSLVRQTEATLSGAAGDRLPTVDGTGDVTASSDRKISAFPKNADNKTSPTVDGVFALAASWAADLFGGLERAEEAAKADVERQAWARRDTALTVASDIARAYIALRGAEQRLVLTEESLGLQRRTAEIVASRVNAGLAPALDLSRAESSVEALAADLRPIEAEIRTARDTLATLLGRRPGQVGDLLPEGEVVAVPTISAAPVIGTPVDLLRRRPDLRAAERDLARATAAIGVASSALYPSLTIPAKFQITSGSFGTADVVHTLLATLGATLDIPLDNGGVLKADVTVAEEQARQALITYRATLLTALSEVEAALNSYAAAGRRVEALERTAAADERAYAQASDLYTQGLSSFLDILDAQRTLTTTRQKLVVSRTTQATAAVDLFQAVGLDAEGGT